MRPMPPEDHVRVLRLDLREHGLEVGFLVRGALARDDRHLGGLEGLLDFVREAFAVRGLVVIQATFLPFNSSAM